MRSRTYAAFTLVEMLVVISIIAILVALFVGVGSSLIMRSNIEKTRGAMATVDNAIKIFFEINGKYPIEETNSNFPPQTGNYVNIPVEEWKALGRNIRLVKQLGTCPQAMAKVTSLDDSSFIMKDYPDVDNGNAVGNFRIFVDGFRKALDYYPNRAAAGMPLLISAGPDGVFNTEDDIRSDRR